MEEKDLQNNEQIAETDTAEDYLKAINELKKNSVSRDEYVKLREENKELLNSLINGRTIDVQPEEKEVVDVQKLRKDLFTKEMNNLDYATTALKLRSALIAQGEHDPFLPIGHDIVVSDDDIAKAKHTAEVLQECVDYAEGDSSIFTDELQRRIIK